MKQILILVFKILKTGEIRNELNIYTYLNPNFTYPWIYKVPSYANRNDFSSSPNDGCTTNKDLTVFNIIYLDIHQPDSAAGNLCSQQYKGRKINVIFVYNIFHLMGYG